MDGIAKLPPKGARKRPKSRPGLTASSYILRADKFPLRQPLRTPSLSQRTHRVLVGSTRGVSQALVDTALRNKINVQSVESGRLLAQKNLTFTPLYRRASHFAAAVLPLPWTFSWQDRRATSHG